MYMKLGQHYAIRVDDLKPIRRTDLEEVLDGDDLLYLLESKGNKVVIADAATAAAALTPMRKRA